VKNLNSNTAENKTINDWRKGMSPKEGFQTLKAGEKCTPARETDGKNM
jgi:hypothetical protein